MAPPPATAVADAMNPPARPRDSQANIDIMAVTKGFHWPWLIALIFALTALAVCGRAEAGSGPARAARVDGGNPFGD